MRLIYSVTLILLCVSFAYAERSFLLKDDEDSVNIEYNVNVVDSNAVPPEGSVKIEVWKDEEVCPEVQDRPRTRIKQEDGSYIDPYGFPPEKTLLYRCHIEQTKHYEWWTDLPEQNGEYICRATEDGDSCAYGMYFDPTNY